MYIYWTLNQWIQWKKNLEILGGGGRRPPAPSPIGATAGLIPLVSGIISAQRLTISITRILPKCGSTAYSNDMRGGQNMFLKSLTMHDF